MFSDHQRDKAQLTSSMFLVILTTVGDLLRDTENKYREGSRTKNKNLLLFGFVDKAEICT